MIAVFVMFRWANRAFQMIPDASPARVSYLSNRIVVNEILGALGLPKSARNITGHSVSLFDPTWAEMCRLDERLTGRPQAAAEIQHAWRLHRARRRDRAARRIQLGCEPWITKPRTRDGKIGITLRLLMASGI